MVILIDALVTSIAFWFSALFLIVILERVFELRIANRNTRQLLESGAKEFGETHYPAIVLLHLLFFVSCIVEFIVRGSSLSGYWYLFLTIFVFAQIGRLWVLRTMKERWTTRILAMKGEHLVSSGPYKLLAHPNYVVVALELFSLPMIFGLTFTAMTFSLANALLLAFIRIPSERKALKWSQF